MNWLETLLRRWFPRKPRAEVPLNEWPGPIPPIYGTIRGTTGHRSYRSARAEPARQSDDNLPTYVAVAMMASGDSCNSSSGSSSDSGGSSGGGE